MIIRLTCRILVLFLLVTITRSQTTEAPNDALIAKFKTPDHRIQDVAFSPDGKLIAAGYGFYDDGGITIWDIASRKIVATLLGKESTKSGIKRVAFSKNGKLFAAAGDNGDVMLWRVGNWTAFKKILTKHGDTTDLTFSPDSTKLAFSSEDNALIYDVLSGNVDSIATAKKDEEEFDGITFTPDGKSVVVSGSSGTQFWDVESKKIIKRWNEPSFNFFGRLSPIGNYFISGGGGVYGKKSVKIRSFPEGRLIKDLTDFRNGIFALAFSTSGKYFALSGGTYGEENSGVFSLWDLEEIKELGFATFGDSPVQGLAFSTDDSILAVGSYEGYVLLYDVIRFRGKQIEKQNNELCGEVRIENNKTYIVPISKIPAIMSQDFVYPWRLEIDNSEAVKDEVGSTVAFKDWVIESSSADDQAKVIKIKSLSLKDKISSDYIVFGVAQNPGWDEGFVVKIFSDGNFVSSNNSGKCLSYGNLSQLKTDYQSVKLRLVDQNLLSVPKEPLTIGAAHYRTQFIAIHSDGVSEIRTDADSFEILVKSASKKREAFTKIYVREDSFLKSLLKAGFN